MILMVYDPPVIYGDQPLSGVSARSASSPLRTYKRPRSLKWLTGTFAVDSAAFSAGLAGIEARDGVGGCAALRLALND